MNSGQKLFDVIIIGGGLAGLTAAIHLSKPNFKVLLIEKNAYPRHKVCGEYISNEVLPYLNFLGLDVFQFGATKIDTFDLTTAKNKHISAHLPLGGFGISRYKFDLELSKLAIENGVVIIEDSVMDIQFTDNEFKVLTKSETVFSSKVAIGAHGKRSNLDINFHRKFIKKKSPYLAVKIHAKGNFPNNTVALHNFEGGYCGVSKVENDRINLCYIVDYKTFKNYKNIDDFQEQVMYKNAALKSILSDIQPLFDAPLTISQISFETKTLVENHVLMCGDSAGMIHPLCGNGMGMAIRSAQIVSKLVINYLQSDIKDRNMLEITYKKAWNKEFKTRLRIGHTVAALFRQKQIAEFMMSILKYVPGFIPTIIRRTHGKLMQIK